MALQPNHVFDPSGDVLLVLTVDTVSWVNDKFITSPGEIEVKVSSKHLSLASKVFHIMFNGNFAERIEPGGEIKRVPLPEDDASAMFILLHIIHGQFRQAPPRISLRTLVAIGLLVDKYDLHEVTEMFTTRWFDNLWISAEFQSSSGLVNWIFLSWTFKKAMEFETVTQHGILYAPNNMDDHGLPVPDAILIEIQHRRAMAVQTLLVYFSGIIEHYGASQGHQCIRHPACDAFVLGDLIKRLRSAGISPTAKPADITTSLSTVHSAIRKMHFTSLCQVLDNRQHEEQLDEGLKIIHPVCHLKYAIRNKISQHESSIRGLRLTFMDESSEDEFDDEEDEEEFEEWLLQFTPTRRLAERELAARYR